MRDLNFFDPFIDKKSFAFNRMLFLYGILFLVIVGLGVMAAMNQLKINALQKEVNSLTQVAEDPQTLKRVAEIQAFEDETDQFRQEVERIRALDKNIQGRDIIGESLLDDINSKLPEGVFLTNLSVSGREIRIAGFAEDRYSIAEFAKGLQNLPMSSKSFVSNISAVENYYRFNLDLTLEEVLVDVN
ncbi:PilN domain-containing protein [Gudongella sp. DL1XJH-153]|uniref:PilN domain-containing protein n=1 Tax=Gudongella sp. DL1XJH-153 TaxID=3409804 RepID=UPI003BB4BB46